MRLRLALILAALGVLCLSGLSSPSSAYRFHAFKWPGGIVRYYNAAQDQTWAVDQAIRAWNASGAHIRFVAVPRRSAQLVILDPPNKIYCSEGRASIGYVSHAQVVLFPARGITHACNRYWAARVTAHELGHVLGLLHEDRGCAVMNAYGSERGGAECPKNLWDWRCRLLEPDDIAGVVAAYGGRVAGVRNPPLCPLYRVISPPSHLQGEMSADEAILSLSFQRPRPPVIPAWVIPSPWRGREGFAISLPEPSCSSLAKVVQGQPRYRWNVAVGETQTFTVSQPSGHGCIAIWALDKLGRPSAPNFLKF